MTDAPPVSSDTARKRITRIIILSGWILTLVTLLVIVGTNVYMMVNSMEIPNTLSQWGSTALGFLFGGTFMGAVQKYIGDDS